jgi:Flp pilus assembly protein TadG
MRSSTRSRLEDIRLGGRSRGRTGEAGATLVEFIVVAPAALLLVLVIIQFGLMLVAKQIVNEAAFVAARAGAVSNAQTGATSSMTQALIKALVPFYQNSLDTTPFTRIFNGWTRAETDLLPLPAPLGNFNLTVLNPNADVFSDFGLTDSDGHTYIPNDSLEYRDYSVRGAQSGLSIQDANALKIQVTYGYQLKVPLMPALFKGVMCGTGLASVSDCAQFYGRGRVPITAYATVQMQTPAWQ